MVFITKLETGNKFNQKTKRQQNAQLKNYHKKANISDDLYSLTTLFLERRNQTRSIFKL
jgi:phage-related protein